MILQLAKFKCKNCKTEFKANILKFEGYGEFSLRTPHANNIAYLNALEDKTYDEVDVLLKDNIYPKGKSANELANVLQNTYGEIACDPDVNGYYYQIGGSPSCTTCNRPCLDQWELIEPPVFVYKEIQSVTHNYWNSLSSQEKLVRVYDTLEKYNSNRTT